MTTNGERQRARFIYTNGKKVHNNFIYKNIDTLQKVRQFASRFIYKKPDNLLYEIFHESFEVGVYVQKVWHFALRDVLF